MPELNLVSNSEVTESVPFNEANRKVLRSAYLNYSYAQFMTGIAIGGEDLTCAKLESQSRIGCEFMLDFPTMNGSLPGFPYLRCRLNQVPSRCPSGCNV